MKHLIGLVLGTEDDWPTAFEALAARVGRFEWRGERHELEIERVFNEPFDLRYKPRYSLVLDRVGWWYLLPREWLKKIALMDDVYLLNNPFTFQSMEKHSAYCAMMRLGLKVPDTWLVPHKQPPWNERFPATAARYNRSFDLNDIGDYVGFPLYLKPFDGGQWRGVSRARNKEELRRGYDESGEQLMHVQSAVDDFEVFARSLSIGAETRVMWFDPDKPMYDRYQVKHDFLTPDQGFEVETISKVVNAFFRWEFNSCESIVRRGRGVPDRLRERVAGRCRNEPALLLPVGNHGTRALVRVLSCRQTAHAHRRRHAAVVRDRRPGRHLIRGEAGCVPAARRRALPDGRLRRVLRRPARAPRRGGTRMVRERRVRPAAPGHGALDVPLE